MGIARGPLRPEGAVIEVRLGPSRAALEASAAPPDAEVTVHALFDTGADITVIQPGLAQRIGIHPHDRIEVAGMHGATEVCNVFDVQLRQPDCGLCIPDLTVVEGNVLGAPRIQVLIGRSVLWKGVLVYDGVRQEFSFEVPDSAGNS